MSGFHSVSARRILHGALGAALALAMPSAAYAGAENFDLINATGARITALSIRRTGSLDWQKLGATPSDGARVTITFRDPDCAFDLRASLAGDGEAQWNGVNLCEVKSVTLRLGAAGATFVDYD
jgi:hypothetical protein